MTPAPDPAMHVPEPLTDAVVADAWARYLRDHAVPLTEDAGSPQNATPLVEERRRPYVAYYGLGKGRSE